MNNPNLHAMQKKQKLPKPNYTSKAQQSLTSQEYPSSLQNSSIKRKQKQVEQLTEDQQEISAEYLASIEKKGLKQLLVERDQLLGELHSINTHLNQMIAQLYGDLQQGSNTASIQQNVHPQKSSYQQQKLLPHKNTSHYQSNQGHVSQSPNPKNKLKQSQKLNSHQLDLLQEKNLKLIQSLQDQLNDFHFMLTPQYFDQLEQEILNSQSLKKQLQSQLTLTNKQLNKLSKSQDSQTLARLQKITYDLSLQLTLLSKKLDSKVQKLNSIHAEQKQKQAKAQSMATQEADLERLLEMYEDQQFEGEQTSRKKRESYDKLQIKKQKLQKIINSYNANHLKLYNKKLSDFRDIHQKIESLNETIKQMDYNIILIARQRKEFEQKNKQIIDSHKNISSTISQNRKLSLRMVDTLTKDKVETITQKRVSENQLVKRNRLTFMRPIQRRQTEQIVPQTQKQVTQNSRYNQKDIRRRVYTELQNSHYFSSIEKNHNKKSEQTLEGAEHNRHAVKRKQHTINDRRLIAQTDQQIPTSDKAIDPVQSMLIRKQSKIHQKKFNLSNTPLSNHKKDLSEQKSFSFYENSQKSINEVSESSSPRSKNHIKTKEIYRKGQSHDIEKGSEDEIEKRLIYLENLLKKGETQLIEPNQTQNNFQQIENPKSQKSSNQIQHQKISPNVKTYKENPGKSSSQSKHRGLLKLNKMQPQSNSQYYKELCRKLGKDKLLIEEDQDISGLIYQGMASKTTT